MPLQQEFQAAAPAPDAELIKNFFRNKLSEAECERLLDSLIACGKMDAPLSAVTAERALHVAARAGNAAAVKKLIGAGADLLVTDKDDCSVLRAALAGGHAETIRAILETGVDPRHRSQDMLTGRNITDISFSLNSDFDIACMVRDFARPFEMLDNAAAGEVEQVRDALKQGVKADFTDRQGNTALLEACKNRRPEVVKALLEYGALVEKPGGIGETPMVTATMYNDAECMRLLGEAGASVLKPDASGLSAFTYVTSNPEEVWGSTYDEVHRLREIEIEKMARTAVRLEKPIAPMKRLRLQPRPPATNP